MGIQDSIISYVRDGIVSGEFKPEQRLKGREYFCDKFNTTPITVQRAFNKLVERGFVTAEKSVGTFIAERPTCLRQVAFLFAAVPGDRNWTSFSQLVVDSVSTIEKSAGVIVKCYFGMGHTGDNLEVFDEFLQDLACGTLVAAVYLAELRYFRSIAWKGVDIPYYDVAQPGQAQGNPRIELTKQEYYEKGISKFKALGRTKIAIITLEIFITEHEDMVKDVFKRNGLEYYEHFVQSFNLELLTEEKPFWIERFLKLLFSLPESERPDGIFITDDNFVGRTCRSLVNIGINPGVDVELVGHANFPIDQTDYPEIYRLGYHVPNAISNVCKNLISGISDNILVQPELR
jgi:DNA-binding LacI/PurR family transcriptional regulator